MAMYLSGSSDKRIRSRFRVWDVHRSRHRGYVLIKRKNAPFELNFNLTIEPVAQPFSLHWIRTLLEQNSSFDLKN